MWLYLPSTSAPATEDSSSPSDPWHGYEPWLTLSGTPTQRPFSWSGWRKRVWIRLLSGMTSPRSTLDRGVAEWISSLPVSRASRSARLGSSVELTMSAGSGQPSHPSSLTWDPDSSCWRTSPSLFDSGSPMSSTTLPSSGSMRNGVCSARQPLAPLTSARGSGSWGTPAARDEQRSVEAAIAKKESFGRSEITSLNTQVKMWMTPTTVDSTGRQYQNRDGSRVLTLPGEASAWPTPTPTAALGDSRRGMPSAETAALRMEQGKRNLDDAAALWPTPKTTDPKHGTGGPSLKQVTGAGRQAVTTSTDGSGGSPTVDLNPFFVATLMGLPMGWLTLSTSAVTASCLRQLHTPSDSYLTAAGGS